MVNNSNNIIKIAFYKKHSNIYDKLISIWTNSIYVHTEIVIDNIWYSSSNMDGGVRKREISGLSGNWDFIELSINDIQKQNIINFFESKIGKKYDWLGIFLSQIIPLKIQDDNRWFCSEIVSESLKQSGFNLNKKSNWYSPARLYKELKGMQ